MSTEQFVAYKKPWIIKNFLTYKFRMALHSSLIQWFINSGQVNEIPVGNDRQELHLKQHWRKCRPHGCGTLAFLHPDAASFQRAVITDNAECLNWLQMIQSFTVIYFIMHLWKNSKSFACHEKGTLIFRVHRNHHLWSFLFCSCRGLFFSVLLNSSIFSSVNSCLRNWSLVL